MMNTMKYQLLFLLLLILGGYTQECEGQNKFRPLKEFNNDTMAYMKKNYDSGSLYVDKTIGHILDDAEIPFKSYVIAETRDCSPAIGFIILFTQSAEEVRALFKAGKPVYGVFCDFEGGYCNIFIKRELYEILVNLGTNRFNDLKKSDAKVLKDIKINWAEFRDQKGWCSMYKVE